MRKLILISMACVFVAAPAMADMAVSLNTNAGLGHANGGGEFAVTVLDAPMGGEPIGIYGIGQSFMTFCVERNEYVSAGVHSYYVDVTAGATHGGVIGTDPDPLEVESAYLYSLWLDGAITTGAVTHTMMYDTAYANAVQEAIWRLEGESTSTGGLAGTLIDWADAAVDAGWTNFNIRVMNLYNDKDHTSYAQDMLVRVPVPAAVLLGMLGLGAAGLKLRKYV